MKKELRPFHDNVACDVCGRTILKGERTEAYLAPGGHRHDVCELCFGRAEHAGWIRESAADQLPTRAQRPQERRALLGRLRRRRDAEPAAADEVERGDQAPYEPSYESPYESPYDSPYDRPDEDGPAAGEEGAAEANGQPRAGAEEARPRRRRTPPQDPRHVRAVPTTAEVKVERALELFNHSEHRRTVAALTRTLGYPWATAVPDATAPSAVTVVVAWELSWYRYRIDLGDSADPVALADKGDEVADIDEALRSWNAGLDADGLLVVADGAPEGGDAG